MKTDKNRSRYLNVVLVLSLLMGGCATSPDTADEGDPLIGPNRAFYSLNDSLDEAILKPVAQAYVDVTPELVRSSVTNFFDNLAYPNVILNDLLQGKILQSFEDSGRFIVNSTFGIGGLFDFASGVGIESHDEDFGQTLGVWGMGEGAYLVIPFLGPNSVRDAPDLVVRSLANVLYFADVTFTWPLSLLEIIDTRANLLSATRLRDESALDAYVFTREAYRQRRLHLIYDGNPPLEGYNGLD